MTQQVSADMTITNDKQQSLSTTYINAPRSKEILKKKQLCFNCLRPRLSAAEYWSKGCTK